MANPLLSAYSRVFILENGARPDKAPVYFPDLRAMGLTQGYGDSERIEVPDPGKLGEFVEVGEVRGAVERPSFGLQGRYPAKLRSALKRFADIGCTVDVHVVIGSCNDPRSYDEAEKYIIIENARITNYETDELGALQSGDNAAVNESADITARKAHEVVGLSYGVKASAAIAQEVLAVTVSDSVSCGSCDDPGDGCQKIFMVTKSNAGSPAGGTDIIFSKDKGSNWFVYDVSPLGSTEDATGIVAVGSYIVVLSDDADCIVYALKSEFDGINPPTFTKVTTGIVTNKGPRAGWSVGNMAFLVGEGGYIYKLENPTSGVTVLDAGSVTTATYNDVHALSETFAVAVGNNGAVVYSGNGTSWNAATTSPVGYGVNINCVWALTEKVWFVGTSDGKLFYTVDAGKTWSQKRFSGDGAGAVRDIYFANQSVGWVSHDTATPRARIMKTTNGGYSWRFSPELTGTLPLADRINALAGCAYDTNFIVGAGLADDGSDGIALIGAG